MTHHQLPFQGLVARGLRFMGAQEVSHGEVAKLVSGPCLANVQMGVRGRCGGLPKKW